MMRLPLILLLLLLGPAIGPAQQPSVTVTADTLLQGAPGLGAFVDSLFAHEMERQRIPGAAIVIIRDGRVVHSRAYGAADIETGRPMSLEGTRIKVGSISKLFVATAALQQAEAGRLDLHADVNRYLGDLRLRTRYVPAVTFHHLLTHTSGFDRPYLGIASRTTEVEPLRAFLLEHFPSQVRPPEQVYAYTDYGMSLAGFALEQVTTLPFERYADDSILARLRMDSSSFVPQQFPDSTFAGGYRWDGERHVRYPLVNLHLLPSGGLSTTAADMGHFLAAQLSEGEFDGGSVLERASVRAMQSRQFGHHPRVPGVAYAFHEDWYYGSRGIRHNGWMSGHASTIYLVPALGVGYFATFTSGGSEGIVWALTQRLNESYPRTPAPERSIGGADERTPRLAGTYRLLEYAERGPERSAHLLLSPTITIADNGDGTLTLHRPEGPVHLIEVEPGVFQWSDGYAHVVFRERDGRQELLSANHVYVRVTPFEQPLLHVGLLGTGLLAFAIAPVAWGVGAVRRRRLRAGEVQAARGRGRRAAIGLGVAFCVTAVVMMLGIIPAFTSMDVNLLAMGAPPALAAALRLGLVVGVLAVLLPIAAVATWRSPGWTRGGRALYLTVALMAVLFAGCLHSLGFIDRPQAPALVREG